jgi:hypothetical protein
MKTRDIKVYILHGMPRIDAIATLAHELTHVWQSVHGRLENDPAFAEGSCNYASYLVLGQYPRSLASRAENPSGCGGGTPQSLFFALVQQGMRHNS